MRDIVRNLQFEKVLNYKPNEIRKLIYLQHIRLQFSYSLCRLYKSMRCNQIAPGYCGMNTATHSYKQIRGKVTSKTLKKTKVFSQLKKDRNTHGVIKKTNGLKK